MKAVTQDLKGPKSESLQPTQSKQTEKKKHLISHRNLLNSYSSLLGKKKKKNKKQKPNKQSAVFQARLFHIRKELIKISGD